MNTVVKEDSEVGIIIKVLRNAQKALQAAPPILGTFTRLHMRIHQKAIAECHSALTMLGAEFEMEQDLTWAGYDMGDPSLNGIFTTTPVLDELKKEPGSNELWLGYEWVPSTASREGHASLSDMASRTVYLTELADFTPPNTMWTGDREKQAGQFSAEDAEIYGEFLTGTITEHPSLTAWAIGRLTIAREALLYID